MDLFLPIFSSSSKPFASELLENLKEMFPLYYMQCMLKLLTTHFFVTRRKELISNFCVVTTSTLFFSGESDTLNSSSSTTGHLSSFGRARTTSAIHESHLDGTVTQQHPLVSNTQTQHRRVASADKNVPISLEFREELNHMNNGSPLSPRE